MSRKPNITETERWGILLLPPWDGMLGEFKTHKFFWDKKNKRAAIADNSGDYPDQTDDGILYIDTTRPIVRHVSSVRAGKWDYSLPLVTPTGEESSTGITIDDVAWLYNNLSRGFYPVRAWPLMLKDGATKRMLRLVPKVEYTTEFA